MHEYCAKRRRDIDIINILKHQEAILRELIRTVRDVMMLRLAKIRVKKTMTPKIYD